MTSSTETSGVEPPLPGNWGRWGAEDELGALNLVDDRVRLRAIRSVTGGAMYSLSHPFSSEAPSVTGQNPLWHQPYRNFNPETGRGSADDVVVMRSHIGTHLDALCHHWDADGLYNSFPHGGVGRRGKGVLSIDRVPGIVTRGVMIDLAAECPSGEAGWGHIVTSSMLERELARADLSVEPGDAVLIRTGWISEFRRDPETYQWGEPGIGGEAAEWLGRHDVCLVGADNWGVEVIPPPVKGRGLHVHTILLNHYGIYLLENLDLDRLAAEHGSCAGLLAVAPLQLTGGAGSPVNPLMVL
jgi:kynurenine formamidase